MLGHVVPASRVLRFGLDWVGLGGQCVCARALRFVLGGGSIWWGIYCWQVLPQVPHTFVQDLGPATDSIG